MAETLAFDQAPQKDTSPTAVLPEDNKSTAKLVNMLLTRSKRASQELREEWPRNYKYVVDGEQWPMRRPNWRFKEVINITWANIMTEVALQTDSRPTVDYNAVEPSDFQFSEVLKKINQVNWEKSEVTGHDWQGKVQTAVFKCKIYHVVHAAVEWNPEMADGLGDVDFKILDSFGCYWDPKAKNVFENRWFIYAEPTPTAELRKQYPKFANMIKPDISGMDEHGDDQLATDIDFEFDRHEFGMRFTETGERGKNKYGGEPMTLKLRCWLKDDTIEELREEKELGNGEVGFEFIKKLKFPKGRYIEVANNITLEDRENEYEDGLFPIARLVNYDYGEYEGETEVKHQKGPNNIANYVWSFILDQMKMANNPQTYVGINDADIINKLTNEPGLAVPVSDINNIRREPGAGIPAGMFQILDNALSLIDKVGGLQDVTRGAPQPGVTSGLMLEGFVEAAQTRPRMKNRALERFLTQVGYLMASRYLQFYTAPRVFRIVNEEGFPEFVEFSISESVDGGKVANIRETAINEQGIPEIGQPRQIPMSGKGLPDVTVSSGSSLPFARAQKTATALDLHGRGAITLESLLKAINWPNPQEEVKAVQQEQALIAQQQAEQGAPQ